MQLRLITIVLRAFLLTAAGIGMLSAQSQAEMKSLSAHISTNAAAFASGSEIDVNVDLTNQSANAVSVTAGLNNPEVAGFEFIVTRPTAILKSPIQMTPYLWTLTGRRAPRGSVKDPDLEAETVFWGSGGEILLKPGSTAHFSALLNNLFDLSVPGSYTIQARKWPYGIMTGIAYPETTAPIESNTITITVTDPPPPAITLELTANATSFTQGSEIDLDIAVTNTSTTPISIPLDPNHPTAELNGFRFEVTQKIASPNPIDSSARSKFSFPWEPFAFRHMNETTLQPTQTIHYPAQMTKLFDLGAPGAYAVQAEKTDPATHLTVKSSTVTIIVK